MFWKKEAAPKHMKFVELGGGLGDTVTLMYTSDRYNSLELLGPDEHATVLCLSHNPFVRELFQWHPKRSQLTVRDLGFWWPKDDGERRAYHKIPPAQPFVFKLQERCSFYPSPEDRKVLEQLSSGGPYVVLSAAAGGTDRNIPQALCEQFADLAIARGFSVAVVGRTYGENRSEIRLRERPGVIHLVDRLSVPGTAKAIEGAAAVVCSHSGICLLSWYLKRPVFLLYPPHVHESHFHSVHQYTFGKDYETTRHMLFSECSAGRMSEFLSMVRVR